RLRRRATRTAASTALAGRFWQLEEFIPVEVLIVLEHATDAVRNPCRTFAEVSYALLCTVMQFATDVTAKNNVISITCAPTNQGVVGSNPAGRANIQGLTSCKRGPFSCCGTLAGPFIHSAVPRAFATRSTVRVS